MISAMDDEFLKNLALSRKSEEERDLICEVAYGKPFREAVAEIRRNDFVEGVDTGKYVILSIGDLGDIFSNSVEIRFVCREYGMPELFLYDTEYPQFSSKSVNMFGFYPNSPQVEFTVCFFKHEIDSRFITALRKWSDAYNMPFDGILNIINQKI